MASTSPVSSTYFVLSSSHRPSTPLNVDALPDISERRRKWEEMEKQRQQELLLMQLKQQKLDEMRRSRDGSKSPSRKSSTEVVPDLSNNNKDIATMKNADGSQMVKSTQDYEKQIEELQRKLKEKEEFLKSVTATNVATSVSESVANNSLQERLSKEKEKNKRLAADLETANSVINTLRGSISQLEEQNSNKEVQLAEEKKKSSRLARKLKSKRKVIKDLENQLREGKQNIPFNPPSPPDDDENDDEDSNDSVGSEPSSPAQVEKKNSKPKIVAEPLSSTSSVATVVMTTAAKGGLLNVPNERPRVKKDEVGSKSASSISHTANSSPVAPVSPSHAHVIATSASASSNSPKKGSEQRRSTVSDLTGHFKELQSQNNPMTLSITVQSPELKLTTIVILTWRVRDTVARLEKKFPQIHGECGLFLKTGKQHYMMMEDDKKLEDYRKLLEDPKTIIEFANRKEFEGKDKRRLRHTPSKLSDPSGRLRHSVSMVTAQSLAEAVKKTDQDYLSSLLNSHNRHPVDIIVESEGMAPIHSAVKSNDTQIVELFLQYFQRNGLDVNVRDMKGNSLLHHACCNATGTDSDDEILRKVLAFPGIQADLPNEDRNEPLHLFCEKFCSTSAEQLGTLLVQKAPSSVNSKNRNGETPLHKAISNPVVRMLMVNLLVKHGADLNVTNSKTGETPLHTAIRLGRKDLVKLLLQYGAEIGIKNANNMTPYELAIESEERDIASIIKQAQDLLKWLEDLKLEDYYICLVKGDVHLNAFAMASEDTLERIFNDCHIDAVGARIRMRKAANELRDKFSKKAFEKRLTQVKRKPSFDPTPEDIERMNNAKNELFADDKTWLIEHSQLEFIKELGSGTSGKVFKGLYRGEKVAIKAMRNASEDAIIEFKKEFHIMSVVHSPNIVHFFGACILPRVTMVMEYCSKGSLFKVLTNPKYNIGWDKGLQFAMGMCKGILTLHTWTPPILHRDMKSANLLLTEDWELKVCDMGLARFCNTQANDTFDKMVGTYTYLAPEVYSGNRYTDKSDVFSMGIILWEIANRILKGKYEFPYTSDFPELRDFQIAIMVAEKGIRPSLPDNCPTEFSDLIARCLKEEKEDRPSVAEMLVALEKMEESYRKDSQGWNSTAAQSNK